jgi:hypothetical protein
MSEGLDVGHKLGGRRSSAAVLDDLTALSGCDLTKAAQARARMGPAACKRFPALARSNRPRQAALRPACLPWRTRGLSGITRGLAAFIGIAELAGALGVVLPMATNVAPWLSAWAAIGLATIMLLAILYHVRRREPPAAPAILFAMAVFVALGRLAPWA